jgi:hypothetical protein
MAHNLCIKRKATQRKISHNERNTLHNKERNEGRRKEMPLAFIITQMVHIEQSVVFLQQQWPANPSGLLLLHIIHTANGA